MIHRGYGQGPSVPTTKFGSISDNDGFVNTNLLLYNDVYLETNVEDNSLWELSPENETIFVTALLTILVGTSIYILSIEFFR
jgi:hypothetical protein